MKNKKKGKPLLCGMSSSFVTSSFAKLSLSSYAWFLLLQQAAFDSTNGMVVP
jgi:hypothetical protein